MSWVYERFDERFWTVGFYTPDNTWHPITDYTTEHEAAARVSYLNGAPPF